MTTPPRLVSVSEKTVLSLAEEDRLNKLREVLGVLEPRNGPSEQAVKTALYDGDAETIVSTVFAHTEKGLEGKQLMRAILALESSGKLARLIAAELKKEANAMQGK